MTLGSFSLFRGLAEGLTGGVDNFTDFPRAVPLPRPGIPARRDPHAVADLRASWPRRSGCCCTGRRSAGRWWRSASRPRGRATPGFPVERRIGAGLSCSRGWSSSLAAIIYVAHLGQAKADAGTGYELLAITAVVLGGTSIFGGRGSVVGTLLGLFAIAVLAKRPAARRPAGRAGRRPDRDAPACWRSGSTGSPAGARPAARRLSIGHDGELIVKNSQVAVLCVCDPGWRP